MDQFADGMSFASSTRKGRGVSWRHQEILDLLDIWGRPKIQEQLHASHRNMDAFEIVAREMHRRGHRRSAVECRSKTKAMRLEYQRVVSHNSSSGKHTATCPYYERLHSILRGDASSWPKRIPRTLKSIRAQAQLTQDLVPDHFEELYTQDMQTESIEGAEEGQEVSAVGHKPEDLADDSIEVCIVEDNSDAASDGIGAESEAEQAETEMEREQVCTNYAVPDSGIQNHQASPSTTACLTMMRTKKRKKGESDMFERLMQHSSVENARLLAALEKDSKVFSEYMRHMREEDVQIREERRAFLNSIDNLGVVLQSLVSGLNKIGEALVKPNHGAAGGLAGNVPCLGTFSGCASSALSNRERATSESTSQPGSPESTSLETLAAMKDASCVPNGQRSGEPFWG